MLDTNPLIIQFLDDYKLKDREITLCWVPSHVGIQGNESVDQAAKETLQQEATEMFIPHSDYKEPINKYKYKSAFLLGCWAKMFVFFFRFFFYRCLYLPKKELMFFSAFGCWKWRPGQWCY